MNTKIFSFVKVSDTSMVASVRIARFVSRVLGAPVVDNGSIGDDKDLDVLVIVNGAFAFCKYLAELGAAIERARRVVWIQNDFTIIPPKPVSGAESPFRLAFRDRRTANLPDMDWWTTVLPNASKTPASMYVNWNCLTFDTDVTPQQIEQRRATATPSLLYYGSYRNQREKTFDVYFNEPHVHTVISSPSTKFMQRYGEKVVTVSPIDKGMSEYLTSHGLGLYIEDKLSHSEYHSPANRFYEMLSAGLPMVFQPECGSMMRKAGYNPEPYYAHRAKDVLKMMEGREALRARQRDEWWEKARGERLGLEARVIEAWSKTEDALCTA